MTTRILVYRIGHLGDTIIALPALWAVRRAFPSAHITLLSSEDPGTGHVAARSVLPQQGLIDDWLSYAVNSQAPISELIGLWRVLRKGRFDVAVYLAPRLRTSWRVKRDILFFRLAGIRKILGHRGFAPLPVRKKGQPLTMVQHEADHLMMRLCKTGLKVPSNQWGEMNLALTNQERLRAEEWLKENVPNLSDRSRLVGFGPGSKWPSKIWPANRFEELGKYLIKEHHLHPIVFGSSAEKGLADRLIQKWGVGANAAGSLDVRLAAAVLERCQYYVGNDTGTMHLAAAVGRPCVAVFAAQDWPGRWYPYGPGHIVLRRSVPCEGCLLSICEQEGLRCLTEISVDDVAHACRQVMMPIGMSAHS